VLTRATPRPEATHPAALLAISAALRGAGALANIAVDTALTADPTNGTARQLRAALTYGLSPDQLRQVLAETVTEAITDPSR
jgi:alkylhydroperoxidase/carboxymuconolactone decarboxylase family protein YurZ